MPTFNSENPLGYLGITDSNPGVQVADRDPATTDNSFPLGTSWINKSTGAYFTYVSDSNWDSGGNVDATTTVAGIVKINTDVTLAGADNTTVPTALSTKTYADNLAIAGAPNGSTTVKGIFEEATDAEVVAGTTMGGTGAQLAVNPGSLAALMAAPGAIGGTTAAAGSFTTVAASGLSSLSGSATVLTAGTALNLGSDNSADAVNLGVGTTARAIGIGNSAAAHVVTVGSVTGASQVVLNSGTAGSIAHTGRCVYTPDSITSDNAGVAASVSTVTTLITTDGDSNEDNVTISDGIAGQVKIFSVVAAGNAADSIKITPANFSQGTKITFAADPTGKGCSMVFDGTNWNIFSNNGGTIA